MDFFSKQLPFEVIFSDAIDKNLQKSQAEPSQKTLKISVEGANTYFFVFLCRRKHDTMTNAQQQNAAREFARYWADKGDEKQETARYWIDLLHNVFGIADAEKFIEFEKRVQLSHTSYIDAYIPETKVLIEQKGAKIDLHKAYPQSDGTPLTPFQQAKRYADEMPNSLRPRWIVVCNFQETLVYDLETPHADPQQIFLRDLEKDYYRLQFIADSRNEHIRREEEVSLKAGELVGKLYDALIKEYIDPDESSLRSLNILCVRIVFCLYAEDAGLFETRTSFEDYIKSFTVDNLRDGIIKLFKALDTPLAKRDKYDLKIKAFPYVNGGLFADQSVEIPNFTEEIADVLVNHCAPFDWAAISPTIFGAVFESTLNPETRRKGGMHYTSVENIHKVIDPLFMDDLNAEFGSIQGSRTPPSAKRQDLLAFQRKLGTLKFLDPACGSGNFLTETYLSLRRLENKVISALNKGEKVLGLDFFIEVKISQFYGIEINDFAVTVAKTALWIAESQMMAETEAILGQELDFLPLTTNAFIVEGNALRMDWATLKPLGGNATPGDGLFSGFTTEIDGEKHEYDYIMGNPPFVGYSYQSEEQKKDVLSVFVNKKGKPFKSAGKIDYVACWYYKTAKLIQNTNTKAALVSTNSITQGEQVAAIWKPLIELFGLQIDFAWQTFRWDSESSEKAHVHCVIIGFSCIDETGKPKRIFTKDGEIIEAQHINGYLLNTNDVWIESRNEPISKAPIMLNGGKPTEGGNLILTEDEKQELVAKNPLAEKFFRPYMMGKDFIDRKTRWCLWLVGANPSDVRKCPEVMRRIEEVRQFRLESPKLATQKKAETPMLFDEVRECLTDYVAIPKVSSERRKFIPMDYLSKNIIPGDKLFMIPNATLFTFGILTSSVHMAWMRAVCGRLKSDYSYSNTIVYNNFPWPSATEDDQSKIGQAAQAILDARALYPEASLAHLYDELSMPPELRRAHRSNDRAVMEAYGFNPKMTENEMVAELFKMYERLTK